MMMKTSDEEESFPSHETHFPPYLFQFFFFMDTFPLPSLMRADDTLENF